MQGRKALTAWAIAGALAFGQAPGTVQVSVTRFYRGTSGLTLVDGFCRVPMSAVSPLPGQRGAGYRVSLAVHDSAGLELVSQSWSQSVRAELLGVPGASVVDHFAFAARPGRYTIDVAITDSATGRVSRERGEVTTYAAPPGASDLLLGTRIRPAGGLVDSTPRPGEVRKGDVFIEASGRPVLTPDQATLGYYLELYAPAPETASVVLRVKTDSGTQLVATAAQRLPLAGGGGATRGTLDLGGLPPGSYQLEVAVQARQGELVRRARFAMAGFETAAAVAAAPGVQPADRFAALNEAQADSLYEPLVYLMQVDERGVYPTLSLEGKRNYLRTFWVKRDPTPGTPRNEEQDAFYTRIGEANRRFREGGAAGIPGWRTDRGRVFIKYGSPNEVLSRPQAGSTAPYEVWKYTRTRVQKYVFYDVTRFGNYALIWTDDRRETSRPNWRDLLGPEAVEDVQRF